jgi:hypothetical protein
MMMIMIIIIIITSIIIIIIIIIGKCNNERGHVRILDCHKMPIRMIWCKMELPQRMQVRSILLSVS